MNSGTFVTGGRGRLGVTNGAQALQSLAGSPRCRLSRCERANGAGAAVRGGTPGEDASVEQGTGVDAAISCTCRRCTTFYAFFMNSDIFVTGGRSRLSVSRMLSLRSRLARASYQQC